MSDCQEEYDEIDSLNTAIEQLRYANRRLTAERDALRKDAERYRWIAQTCRSTGEHWGGRWSIVVEGPSPTRHDDEEAFDVAIDAAMAQEKRDDS